MGRAGRIVLAAAVLGVTGLLTEPAVAQDPVLVDDAGPGFVLVGDQAGANGMVTRTFRHPSGELTLQMLPIGEDLDVRTLFGTVADVDVGLDQVEVPGLPLARWFVTPGVRPEDAPAVLLVFASRHHIFTALLATDDPSALAPVPTLLDLARRQIERAGGPPEEGERPADPDALALVPLLPESPDPRFAMTTGATLTGTDALAPEVGIDHEVVAFLDSRAHTAVRTWADADGTLVAAASLTEYPYDIFAAADLGATEDGDDIRPQPLPGLDGVDDVFTFLGTGPREGEVGASLRRGNQSVVILARGDDLATAAAVVVDLTLQAAGRLSQEGSAPYRFPSPPSTTAALALTSGLVTAAALTSIGFGRARAWTLRRAGAASMTALPASPAVIDLDPDARELRHRGAVVVVVQLVALNVIIIGLAGDFGWTGVAVAALGLAGGLGFTHWWRRRELGAIGPGQPRSPFVLPRLGGAVLGVVALIVLAIGVSYALKGLRYLVLRPTLAQLQWSDRLGLPPRAVGVVFALGGLASAAIGGVLFRIARSLGRAQTRELLAADRRPPALYLRSFEDDVLPVATIASARRPFFELFSFRGRDPFEEAVAWELSTYGPVVAVGRPGHSLASLGAAREHLSDDTWKVQVAARMDDALVLAVGTGETPGLHWEIAQLVSAGHLDRTVFVFPPLDGAVLARRWEFTATALQAAGAEVGPLPTAAELVHTAQVGAGGAVRVTVARRRDEASYRTAVDRAMASVSPGPRRDVRPR